jgi:2-polyprenyl-3-methyl-5-hydroxy-6-metoxy-1,4-benzoquinol methylase
VSECCSPRAYRRVFSEESAWRQVRRYRRRGLDRTSRRIVELLLREGVAGQTVLEVGGGIGALQLELLRAGARRAVSVELTPTYEAAAADLLRGSAFEDRVERLVMDFADSAAAVEAADVVVLNRVICCYPDLPKLAAAAADHTRRVLVLSFPNESRWTRAAVALANLPLLLARFRIFVHPVRRLREVTAASGLRASFESSGLFWQVAAFERD